ncbi:MAG: CDP-glucose 4,6-dehydratase, partial [Lachnospiraceae bacterium]|nr:CDP-glucose 4,6-dehydratase [Lachnospiraceae bacterium]
GDLVTLFCDKWNESRGLLPEASWKSRAEQNAPHEADFLKLDSTKIKSVLSWKPKWHIDECMEKTVHFYQEYLRDKESVAYEMDQEISKFFK